MRTALAILLVLLLAPLFAAPIAAVDIGDSPPAIAGAAVQVLELTMPVPVDAQALAPSVTPDARAAAEPAGSRAQCVAELPPLIHHAADGLRLIHHRTGVSRPISRRPARGPSLTRHLAATRSGPVS